MCLRNFGWRVGWLGIFISVAVDALVLVVDVEGGGKSVVLLFDVGACGSDGRCSVLFLDVCLDCSYIQSAWYVHGKSSRPNCVTAVQHFRPIECAGKFYSICSHTVDCT